MFDITSRPVWISDEKYSYSCVIYISLVFGYQMKHPFLVLIYYFSLVIPNKTPHLVFTILQHTLVCFFRLLLKSLTLKL